MEPGVIELNASVMFSGGGGPSRGGVLQLVRERRAPSAAARAASQRRPTRAPRTTTYAVSTYLITPYSAQLFIPYSSLLFIHFLLLLNDLCSKLEGYVGLNPQIGRLRTPRRYQLGQLLWAPWGLYVFITTTPPDGPNSARTPASRWRRGGLAGYFSYPTL